MRITKVTMYITLMALPLLLSSCTQTTVPTEPDKKPNDNGSGIELDYDTTEIEDTIPLD